MIITLGSVGHFKHSTESWETSLFVIKKHLVHMIFTQILVILAARAHAKIKNHPFSENVIPIPI